MIDYKNFFKPEEFLNPNDAEYANAKLWAALQCERRVYADTKIGEYHGVPLSWQTMPSEGDTHHGIIINLGKLVVNKAE